jgi:hypothetical protein
MKSQENIIASIGRGARQLQSVSSSNQPAKVVTTQTYITTKELAERIKFTEMSIRNCLQDSILIEGVHYFRPFGGRKILYIWEVVEADMKARSSRYAFTSR